tara:strand:+ start:499 stop:1758 length:1260 start_codon:yes stop_codon:yes gene_type:complete
MSKLKTNTIQHTGGSADNITLDNSQNVTAEGNLTVDGNLTVSGTSTISGYNPTSSRNNRNLIINGAMQVAQRGVGPVASWGYQSVDRFTHGRWGHDEELNSSQVDVSVGSSPYNLPVGDGHPFAHGFRKCWQIQNGNQTGGFGAGDGMHMEYFVESQDIATSGWNYTSSSSYLTLSFWVKSSVAQNFYGYVKTQDGTQQLYPFETGSLVAHTWTKITKSIPGHANLQFDTDTTTKSIDKGLVIELIYMSGTDETGTITLNQWGAFVSAVRTPDGASGWWTQNDATLQMTGVQLEVGSVATDFEHRSYGDELHRCLRYCQRHAGVNGSRVAIGVIGDSTTGYASFPTKVPMRTTPSISVTEAGKIVKEGSAWYDLTSLTIGTSTNDVAVLTCVVSGGHGMSALDPFTMGDSTDFTLNAEL